MRRIALFVACLFVLCSAGYAKAEDSIDFGTISCSEFIQDLSTSSEDDAALILMWLDGYLSGVTGDTKLRFNAMESFGSNLVDACSKSPNSKVLDVARIVGISN